MCFKAPNSDGIDVDSSSDVLVREAFIRVGDDAVAIKSGLDAAGRAHARPSERVTVRDSHLAAQSKDRRAFRRERERDS